MLGEETLPPVTVAQSTAGSVCVFLDFVVVNCFFLLSFCAYFHQNDMLFYQLEQLPLAKVSEQILNRVNTWCNYPNH